MSRAMHWSAAYVGLDAAEVGRHGALCWGVVVMVYAGLGIALPSYKSGLGSARDRRRVRALAEGAIGGDWIRVDDTPRDYDVLLWRGDDLHVALQATPGRMLHLEDEGDHVRLEPWPSPLWPQSRLLHVCRHVRLRDGAPA